MFQDDEGQKLPAKIWPALANKLWHATHIDNALSIVADGEIRPNANSKYGNGYCRSLGGISLFDFRHGDNALRVLHCNWTRWLSGHNVDDQDEIGVWFEIDPTRTEPHIAEKDIYAHYMANRTYGEDGRLLVRDPMPHCEACYIGSIPLNAIRNVLLIDGRRLSEHEAVPADESLLDRMTQFRLSVRAKPPFPPTLADKLRQARSRFQSRPDDRL